MAPWPARNGKRALVTGIGTVRLLEALREATPECRFSQASSSELFGKVHEVWTVISGNSAVGVRNRVLRRGGFD